MNRKNTLLLGIAALLALIPFLFWRATWFGRRLSEKEIGQYLAGDKPRLAQHALAQVAQRIIGGEIRSDQKASWYPRIVFLSGHAEREIRNTAAWVMGQDNSSEEFHEALRRLLRDDEPRVRMNAALALVRFADVTARPEILAMLRPYTIQSPQPGSFSLRPDVSDSIGQGTLLGKVTAAGNQAVEIRSPLAGRIRQRLAAEGQAVKPGDPLFLLSPDADQVWEALRALTLIGREEDLPVIESVAGKRGDEGFSDKVREQAALTARSIRSR